MKSLTVFALLICFVCAVVAEVNKKCTTGTDCEEGECCMHLHSFISNRCRKLRGLNEFCMFDKDIEHPVAGVYRFMCPCVKDLECKAEKTVKEKDGSEVIHNSKCTAKE